MDYRDGFYICPNESSYRGPVAMNREKIAIIIGVHVISEILLLLVGDAFDCIRFDFCPSQGRQEDRGKDGDNCDNNEQFDQGKSPRPLHSEC